MGRSPGPRPRVIFCAYFVRRGERPHRPPRWAGPPGRRVRSIQVLLQEPDLYFAPTSSGAASGLQHERDACFNVRPW